MMTSPVIWTCLPVAVWLVLVASAAATAHAADRPNIVLILADDQAYGDFGFMGNSLVHTPHLDQLAASSARYSNGYVPMSVCRPSLATLLTGLYPHQHGIHFNHPPPGLAELRKMTAAEYVSARARTDYLIERVPTLPRLLAERGYVCLQTGKHWEGSFRTAGFTHGMTLTKPTRRLGQVTGTRAQAGGEWVAHGNGDAGLVIGRETMQPIEAFLDEHAERQPFLVWYAPFLPHAPFDAEPRFRELYQETSVPAHLLPYYAEIARFDETVGQLMEMLERRNLIANTIVVFLSDNGFRPDPKILERADERSKLSEFENGLRTPVLISWPGKVRPAEHPQLVHSIDVVPTLLSAVGLSAMRSESMRGRNLMPSAMGVESLDSQAVFGAIYGNDARELGNPAGHARGLWIRDNEFKLVLPGQARDALPAQLYNLDSDPDERMNLVGDPAYAKIQARLTDSLARWWPEGFAIP